MADKNKGEIVCDANPHDLKDYFEFAHAITVAIGNNCPTPEWCSWEDVPGNVKKVVMDEVLVKKVLAKKKLVVQIERYRRKQVPYFEGKNLDEAYAKFKYDVGNLVQRDCSAKFESWKKVPEELKKSMLRKLSVHWDVDETDEKQWIYVDGLFKQSFRQWKFDVLRAED
ncbi:uncharacterized protein LOC126609348 [Malus sylvestris]|uniref:uncharacterized protein LOC126609348 n=1 Tax=Malus sylvestris TaxID=3752 RepID=UPI0021ACD4B5|nr:uncharacterized protein LOC126609348 [Malus sylvestris]